MKKSLLIVPAILFAGLVLIDLIDSVVPIPNASVSAKEATGSISKASSSSPSATITMYTMAND